jgi:hypothetical protein
MAPRPIADALRHVIEPALDRRGRHFAVLVAEWPNIVGKALAQDSVPVRLAAGRRTQSGDLVLRVEPAAAIAIQHQSPQIIARINAALGHAAVERLKLVHGPVMTRPSPGRKKSRDEPAPLEPLAETLADPELAAALARLRAAIRHPRRR